MADEFSHLYKRTVLPMRLAFWQPGGLPIQADVWVGREAARSSLAAIPKCSGKRGTVSIPRKRYLGEVKRVCARTTR